MEKTVNRGEKAQMQIWAPGVYKSMRPQGFTLVELMVVIGLIGLMLGLVRLTVNSDPAQLLHRDAQRLAASLSAAQSQASASGQLIRLRPTEHGWQYEIRQRPALDADPAQLANPAKWQVIQNDEVLGPRQFLLVTTQLHLPSNGVILGSEPFGINGQALRLELRAPSMSQQIVLEQGLARVLNSS